MICDILFFIHCYIVVNLDSKVIFLGLLNSSVTAKLASKCKGSYHFETVPDHEPSGEGDFLQLYSQMPACRSYP